MPGSGNVGCEGCTLKNLPEYIFCENRSVLQKCGWSFHCEKSLNALVRIKSSELLSKNVVSSVKKQPVEQILIGLSNKTWSQISG